MGAFLAWVGWVFVSYLWHSYQRAATMDGWIATSCRIESLEVDSSQPNQRGFPKHRLQVAYRYTYEGRDYTGDRIKRLPTEASDPRKLKRPIESYAAGTETVCYVDPADPASAVLKKDSKAPLYTIWFPCLFIVGGLGIALSALLPRRLVTRDP